MEDHTKHYLISGRVQGVGFRMFVHRQATQLKLKGWVRNLNDGRVETVAQGPPELIKKFEDLIRTGPSRAIVESLQVGEKFKGPTLAEFAVRGDGDQPCTDES